jgi:vitamin B12 transporter
MIYVPADTQEIVITASRAPQAAEETPASVTVIDAVRIERLGEPLLPALLRLAPSTAVASSGPAGSLTEVRIRGAEANHTLLFIDGVRANDPASGNTPRFELLNADLASRIELVRGPQSALWGSEAVGGVIAVEGAAPSSGFGATAEAGSFGFRRTGLQGGLGREDTGLAAAIGWQRSDGIDTFGGGDRDGYRNLSGRVRGNWRISPALQLGATAFALTGRSEFDGFDPNTFARTHDLESRNRLAAGRLWARAGSQSSPWRGELAVSALGSANRNDFQGESINRTSGGRTNLDLEVERSFTTGSLRHLLIGVLEHEAERFTARDTVYGGFTDQDRRRDRQSLAVEWRAAAGPVSTNLALRHDRFESFKDSTTLRAGLVTDLGGGVSLAGAYGEGIAQPSFFDLFGFFPGSFVGNPSLKPESSRGVEASVRYRRAAVQASLTAHRQRLQDEIVDVFDTFPFTTRNREEKSRRSGIEAELGWAPSDRLRLTGNYAYLDASEPSGTSLERELRRPKHSGSIAADGQFAKLSYGVSLAYTGARFDRRDDFPFDRVRLGAYWLAGARAAYTVRPGLELFARTANAFDERYVDVFGYRTEGRSAHAGIRLAPRR